MGTPFAVFLFLLGLPFCLAEGGSTGYTPHTVQPTTLPYSLGDDAHR